MSLKRIFEPIKYQLENFPQPDALACKRDGNWIKYSTEQVCHEANQLSLGLIQQKIEPADRIGIISFNRPEWVFTDIAISQIGAVSVPMYPNSTADDYRFIISDSHVKIIFAGDQQIYDKLQDAISELTEQPIIYSFDELQGVPHWKKLKRETSQQGLENIDSLKGAVDENDLATLIYTSGTTGNPKGVMLTHKNILSNSDGVAKVFEMIGPEHRTLSFLPLCHIFARTGLYTYMQLGVSIYYAQSMDTIGEDIKEVKPHLFATVPRLLEKVYEKIIAKGYELKGIKKALFFWAVKLGEKYDLENDHGVWYNFQLKLANKLIFSKWREALGGNLKFIVSGAAALQTRLGTIFWAGQIPILEAYGLTETSPAVSFSTLNDVKIGCVGPLIDQVQVKIAEDGEILVKSPGVMKGYYNRPEATAEVINEQGWFHTGDIGEMVNNHFLKITDRKKEMFKTSGGKYIAPQILENKFKESFFIEQIMVIGEGQKFPAALIVPFFDALKEWCLLHNINYTTDSEMITHEKVIAKFESEVEIHNQDFAKYEQPKKFQLLENMWTIEGGELTPTLKLKRKVIKAKYASQIEKIYNV